jgi:CheY-like chemotaxis protein
MKAVLCIDDDITGLSLRKMMLEGEGYYVFTANNGEEGLALLDAQRIDAVILDYRMPEMTGGEVARRIRDRWSNIPVLMLSGYPDDVPEEAVHLVDAFVTKGEAPERLLQVLAANLQGRSLGRITILNVDDNQEHRYAITRVLQHAGFNVIEARTGREALQLAWSRPGLVVLDINLPDMLGFDVCRRLKSNRLTRDIPVIHISATYPTEQFGKLSVNSGASGFIEHPNDLTELVVLVEQELQKHPQT